MMADEALGGSSESQRKTDQVSKNWYLFVSMTYDYRYGAATFVGYGEPTGNASHNMFLRAR